MTRWIENPQEKQDITRSILTDLPECFGIPKANQNYENEAKHCPMVAHFEGETPVGFFALKETGPKTLSLHVLGVKKAHHGKGIGKALFEEVKRYANDKGYRFFTVKTLDPARESEEYRQTRLFYEKIGFVKLETFATLWDEDNPCLLMVRHVNDAKNTDG